MILLTFKFLFAEFFKIHVELFLFLNANLRQNLFTNTFDVQITQPRNEQERTSTQELRSFIKIFNLSYLSTTVEGATNTIHKVSKVL